MTFIGRNLLYFLGFSRFRFQVSTLLSVVRKLIEIFEIISYLLTPCFNNLTIPIELVEFGETVGQWLVGFSALTQPAARPRSHSGTRAAWGKQAATRKRSRVWSEWSWA